MDEAQLGNSLMMLPEELCVGFLKILLNSTGKGNDRYFYVVSLSTGEIQKWVFDVECQAGLQDIIRSPSS